jgi:ABC-type multidrug transport system ATPase subunit
MTLIATIHSPQSEILQTFDRLVLLSSGHTIYNGLVSEIPSFLSGLGYKLKKHENPADVMIKMAHEPTKISPNLTVERLVFEAQRSVSLECI